MHTPKTESNTDCHNYKLFWYKKLNQLNNNNRSKVALVQEGGEPMTHCELCWMHMPAGRLIKNRKTERCDKNTQMLWRSRDVAIADKRLEETLSITGEDEAEYIEGVEVLKYLRRLIYWLDDNCPEFLQNTRKARQMWVWLGKILRTEGE